LNDDGAVVARCYAAPCSFSGTIPHADRGVPSLFRHHFRRWVVALPPRRGRASGLSAASVLASGASRRRCVAARRHRIGGCSLGVAHCRPWRLGRAPRARSGEAAREGVSRHVQRTATRNTYDCRAGRLAARTARRPSDRAIAMRRYVTALIREARETLTGPQA